MQCGSLEREQEMGRYNPRLHNAYGIAHAKFQTNENKWIYKLMNMPLFVLS